VDRIGVAEHVPLLGQDDELGPGRGGAPRERVGALEVGILVVGRGQLNSGDTHQNGK
jgi:hypothetical protein